MIRTRFAPSPTGFLHVGGLRTALYSFLFAKKNHGQFVLRIEDTDQSRLVTDATTKLISALNWAGLSYDEGPQIGGDFGPYIQSERLAIYQEHIQKLLAAGHAYYCFCSPERLELVRARKIAAKLPPAYDRTCRNLDQSNINEKIAAGERFVVRMKVPLTGESVFTDLVRGTVTIDYKNIDDQVLLKSDGFPTYHLAVVVDDHLMQISHVIRGEEWLSSTPKHLLLYNYFGWQAPLFAHIPLLLNPDKSKLSKRQGDVAVEDYIKLGYTKEALVNFIALLGWNPGSTREIFSLDELVTEFSLERVGKSGAIFNVEKLRWLNHKWLTSYEPAKLRELVLPFLSATYPQASTLEPEILDLLLKLIQKDLITLADSAHLLAFYFAAPTGLDKTVFENLKHLDQVISMIKNKLPMTNQATFLPELKQELKAAQIHLSELFPVLRYALTGSQEGFGIQDLIDILGISESNTRLESFINKF